MAGYLRSSLHLALRKGHSERGKFTNAING
jgi:hypothetical protein